MKLQVERKKTTLDIEGYKVEVYFPTTGDKIAIRSQLHVLTNGQYDTMVVTAVTEESRRIVTLTEAVATLNVVAPFLKGEDGKAVPWSQLSNDEGETFILEVYEAYLNWRNSFRRDAKGVDVAEQKDVAQSKSD